MDLLTNVLSRFTVSWIKEQPEIDRYFIIKDKYCIITSNNKLVTLQ